MREYRYSVQTNENVAERMTIFKIILASLMGQAILLIWTSLEDTVDEPVENRKHD